MAKKPTAAAKLPSTPKQLMAAMEAAAEGWTATKRKGADAKHQEVFDSMELTLRAFQIDLDAARDGDDWYRFKLEGNSYELGRKSDKIVVYALVCATDADVDQTKLQASMKAADKGNRAHFREMDCYIYAVQEQALSVMSEYAFPGMFTSCRDALASPGADKLRTEYAA